MAVDGLGHERLAHEVADAGVVVAVNGQQGLAHPVVEETVGDALHLDELGDRAAQPAVTEQRLHLLASDDQPGHGAPHEPRL